MKKVFQFLKDPFRLLFLRSPEYEIERLKRMAQKNKTLRKKIVTMLKEEISEDEWQKPATNLQVEVSKNQSNKRENKER